ncbi:MULTISPECIES: MFS transporter [unclassified Sphingobium]|uniref:MFS transporter n=1 Tax=unclassified Sphingobium TaxID=2611147 RepID=UPI001E39FC20|nr:MULTISPECIES: MFS transporter [unclassified Sphingobium]CAH0351866.1 Enterobactin exporter EntS [Sphingobium sp. CECT 9361]|tara:strand:- start:3233 stop:4897 length:1665 start_codon:yes stop_codon:yes gene_type:complete
MPTTTASPPSISPLRIPIFRAVWLASMASNFGGLIQSVGASWMMTSLATSNTLVALVQASTTLPIMLLSLLAGAMADNLDRRLVMLWAQGFMLAVSLALAAFAWAGWLTPVLLLGFTFLIGCGTAFNGPAWQASVGDMVPRATLPGAIALNSMGFNIARSLGPAIGGVIVAAAGAAAAFAINAVSYVGLIAVLVGWRPERVPRVLPREDIGTAMGAGVRYVAMSPNLRIVLVRSALFGFAASAIPALMPLIARDQVAGGPLTYGLLLGAFGVGAVGGALGSGRLRNALSTEWIVRIAATALTVGAAVGGVSTLMPLTLMALFLAGAGWVLALSTFTVTVQMAAPRWVVGRAVALYQMAAFGGMALGSWVFGEVADMHGVAIALAAAAAVQALSVPLGLFLPLPQGEALNLDPQNRWSEPDTAVPIEPRSGPVVVTIEYRILSQHIRDFLAVMNERRRIRVRDGARHWTLLRDLGDENLWIERYTVPTWLEYIRHNQRRTHADTANSDLIQALHQGPNLPQVHRMIERQTSLFLPSRTDPPPAAIDPLTDPTRSS